MIYSKVLNTKQRGKDKMAKMINFFGGTYEGLIKATDGNGWCHVSADTKLPVYRERYKYVGDFYCERAVAVGYDNKYFHIKHDGKPAYTERFQITRMFRRVGDDLCLAPVLAMDGTCFHIDQDGNRPYGQSFHFVGNFIHGLSPVRDTEDGLFYYIKPDGSEAFGPKDHFDLAGEFANGVAIVVQNGRKYKLLPDGSKVIILKTRGPK